MRRQVAVLASLAHFAFSATLAGVGATGVVFPRWELATLLGFDAAILRPADSATMLNQYRYRSSVELVAGITALMFRRPILAGRKEAYAFLILVAVGCIARIIAWLADGQPSAIFIGILAAEILTFVVVALHLGLSRVES